jgi:hypothetical protein
MRRFALHDEVAGRINLAWRCLAPGEHGDACVLVDSKDVA